MLNLHLEFVLGITQEKKKKKNRERERRCFLPGAFANHPDRMDQVLQQS